VTLFTSSRLFLFQTKPDLLFLGFRWNQELPDGFKNDLKLSIVFFLYLFDLPSQIFMGSQDLSKPGEGPHDLNIDLDGPFTIENAGKHGNAIFGEGIR
jgi:hypothetical protein